ncbi:hypothetical protein HK101_001084 [Irineochytrium annulatum]|nr:hypothetical protein HK101_001084 [Irineochytrium annulatum]
MDIDMDSADDVKEDGMEDAQMEDFDEDAWDQTCLQLLTDSLGSFYRTHWPSLPGSTTEQDSGACEEMALLQEVTGLAAYDNPFLAPQRHLLMDFQRDHVADAVNFAILGTIALLQNGV